MTFAVHCAECRQPFLAGQQHFGISGTDLDLCESCQELVITRRRTAHPSTALNQQSQEDTEMAKKTAKTDKTITTVEKLRREKKAKAPKATKTLKPQRDKTARASKPKGENKTEMVVAMIKREGGATLSEIGKATGWQPHSVRGFIAGTAKKKLGLKVTSSKPDGGELTYAVA